MGDLSSPTVSVVVPVYNTPIGYLKPCIDSAARQSLPNVEVLVVDDGSDENIATYLDSLQGGRVLVLHKTNGGLSDARNFGVARSSGDYVYFLDSDDSLASEDSLSELVAVARHHEAEIVVGEYHFKGGGSIWEEPSEGVRWLGRCLKNGSVSFAAADQLYTRCLLDRMGELFRVGLVHEDEEFVPRSLLCASTVVGLPGFKTYVRNVRDTSITRSQTPGGRFDRCKGKLIVARDSLADEAFSCDAELRALMDERAFGFANMAFKTWAENLMETEYHPVLLAIADQIDYSRAVFTARHPRAFRNWTCMKVIRVLGVERYLELLHLTFGRGVR